MRLSTGDRTFFIALISAMSDLTSTNGECEWISYLSVSTCRYLIAVVSAMSDLTLTTGECEDRHRPKGLSIAEHVWMLHNGSSVYAVLYW